MPGSSLADTDFLRDLAAELCKYPAVLEKVSIHQSYAPALSVNAGIQLGDDCAAIPDPASDGYLLFAAEGMLESFVEEDPWFAGYSAVMVNLSDVAAMGGRPLAITNTLWATRGPQYDKIWQGMQSASEAYDVPIVGGHTTQTEEGTRTHLGASVLGRAGKNLLTSFDARAGDQLVVVVDLNGAYRRDKLFWNASTSATPDTLRANLELLPLLAERELCRAGKDISNGGIVGTLAMLCHCSGVGVDLDLDHLVRPAETSWLKWLTTFPSYGYIIAVPENTLRRTRKLFESRGISVSVCGEFTKSLEICLHKDGASERLRF